MLMGKLPAEHKARWFSGAALNTSTEAMSSVLSTALSRLNGFLDSELEQILCFDSCINAEKFCGQKSALFLVLPEEDVTKHFLISLIVQQLYREILLIADEMGGALKNRVMLYLDEIGTIPRIESAEMIFSASRSRKVSIVAIIQSLSQFEKSYGKEGANIIVDNCQNVIFGGFAPNSTTAKILSESLGSQTVLSGSVSKGKNESQSLQMIQRPLMTPDELKSMQKFHFIVMKTGAYPMKTKLELYFKWGITFEKPYELSEQAERKVEYADRREVEAAVKAKYPPCNSVLIRNSGSDKQVSQAYKVPSEFVQVEESIDEVGEDEITDEGNINTANVWKSAAKKNIVV